MASVRKVGDKWLVRVRRKGHEERSMTFATKILAEKWGKMIESEMDAGRGGGRAPSKLTFGSLIDRYVIEIGGMKKFGRNKEATLKMLRNFLGDVPIHHLTTERIVKYITEERRIAGVTAAIDLSYLGGVLRVAHALWRVNTNPAAVDDAREILKHMGALNRSTERDRRPTADEIERIIDWFGKHSRSLTPDRINFILDSCFRPPSEVINLRWSDINHEDRTIVIHDRKHPRYKIGNNQIVPLLGRCYEIVMRQPKTSEFIFPAADKTWSSIFARACHDLGIVDLRLYDFRHEAISRLVEANKHNIPEMMLVTGHKDPKQLMRYTQIRAKNLHR